VSFEAGELHPCVTAPTPETKPSKESSSIRFINPTLSARKLEARADSSNINRHERHRTATLLFALSAKLFAVSPEL
jgi:hypothetical protein